MGRGRRDEPKEGKASTCRRLPSESRRQREASPTAWAGRRVPCFLRFAFQPCIQFVASLDVDGSMINCVLFLHVLSHDEMMERRTSNAQHLILLAELLFWTIE
ncbi:hypothetical protein VPH35_007987 [Triticum aestivum]